MDFGEKIVAAIRQTMQQEDKFVPLHAPRFVGQEWTYLKDCLDSTFVSTVGKYVDQFEDMLSDFTGIKSVTATVNGTSALHIALKLVGVKKDEEVLVPALTFVATVNAITYCGATPHFVDVEEKTLGLDPVKLDRYLQEISETKQNVLHNKYTGRPIRAVLAMHTYGHPVDLDPLVEACKRYGLRLVEDGAESLGSSYKGTHTGHWGDVSIVSFNGNKIITTGGGGAILTNDEKLGKQARHLTTTAKTPHRWEFFHDEIGFNYRMPNINAALGCAQLEQLPSFIANKRSLARKYSKVFAKIKGITFFEEPDFARSNYWLNVLILKTGGKNARNAVLDLSNSQNVMTRPAWTLMHKLPMFKNSPKMDLGTSQILEDHLINIPSSVI